MDLPLPRSNEDWALVHEESPKNNPLLSQTSVISLFNHTATFRTESDLPLTLQYLESLGNVGLNLSIVSFLDFHLLLYRYHY